MIESIDNILQIAVLLVCTLIAAKKALDLDSRDWTLLAFFFANFALDDLYLVICLLTVGESSILFVVSELSWYAAFIFLYLLILQAAPPETAKEKRLLPWLGPVFAAGMAVFFIQWGKIVSNLIYAVLIGLILFAVTRRLMDRERYARQRPLCVTALVFCLLEYALWTASCFFEGESITNPYYLFDLMITLCFPFFIRGTRKAVGE